MGRRALFFIKKLLLFLIFLYCNWFHKKKKNIFCTGLSISSLRLGGGWGSKFPNRGRGVGVWRKKHTKISPQWKKKKKQPNFEKIKSFSIFSFRQKVRFIFEKGTQIHTKYTKNIPQNDRYNIFSFSVFFVFLRKK